MKTLNIDLIQKCQLSDNTFSKQWLIKLLTDNIDSDQFNIICKEIMLLNERYATTIGLHVTDRPDLISSHGNEIMWELDEIDFNQPITFKQIL